MFQAFPSQKLQAARQSWVCAGHRRPCAFLPSLLCITWLAASLCHAQAYQEGVHYERLPVPVETAVPLEVTEVFSYACIHCYRFEPALEQWRANLPDDVVFRRVPAVFNSAWEFLARLFYAAELLKVTETVHKPLFDAIHRRGLNVLDPQVATAIFREAAAVDAKAFNDALGSFAVASQVQRGKAASKAYRVTAVPTLIVNGKFRIDSGMLNGGQGDMLRVADYLIDAEGAAQAEPEG